MRAKNQHERLTRRGALKQIAGTASAAISFPILSNGPTAVAADMRSIETSAHTPYTPKFFNSDQMKTIGALADRIIPADDQSPGALAARVHEFIDIIVAESSRPEKDQWRAGLAVLDQLSQRECGKEFAECDLDAQDRLLRKISQREDHPNTPEEIFFAKFKGATIEGYYTSAIGIHQDLQYQGNTALAEFEGCAHAEHKKPSP